MSGYIRRSAGAGSPAVSTLFPPAATSTATEIAEQARLAFEHDIPFLSVEEIDAMEPGPRVEYLTTLHRWQVEQGISSGLYQRYREYEKRCKETVDEITGQRCQRQRWEHSPRCLEHSSVDEIDPKGVAERRKAARRARAEKLTDAALDELEKILLAPDGEIAPSVRMKAIEAAFDRGGLPKVTESKHEVNGEVTHTVEARDFIDSKLSAMRESLLNRELAGIENASVVEAEVVDDVVDVDDEDAA